MTPWDLIRDARAEAAEAVFRELGVLVDLVHDGATTSNLVAYLERSREHTTARFAAHGVDEQRVLHLPRQANFSGSVRPGDLIVYPAGGATRYVVHEIESDAHEAVYRIRARRAQSPVGVTVG